MASISLQNVSRTFSGKNSSLKAIDDVSLEVETGDVYGIIGFSGAGKSTLLRTINLLERPDSGTVWVDGEELTRLSKPELRQQRRSIGMIFQHFNLVQNATVSQNVAFPLEIAAVPRAERQRRVEETLDLVGLADKAHAYPAKLSGGQKQRVGIARTLVARPRVLLCDEPTSALDPQTTDNILAFLSRLNRDMGLTIVLVTHEMAVVNAICSKVSVMEQGKVVESFDLREKRPEPKSAIASYLFGQTERETRRHA